MLALSCCQIFFAPLTTVFSGMQCAVCLGDGNVRSCPGCNFHACSDCSERWGMQVAKAECMQCNRPHTRGEHTHAFWAKLRERVAEKDWMTESSLLHATKAHMSDINAQKEARAQVAAQLRLRRKLVEQRRHLLDNIRACTKRVKVLRRARPRARITCSQCAEPCIGHSCHSCHAMHCALCHQLAHEGSCNADDLSATAFVTSQCRRCPGCHAPIQKAGGCDHMTCRQCRTEFSWSSGRFVTHPIIDEFCGGLPHTSMLDGIDSEDPYFWLHYEQVSQLRTHVLPLLVAHTARPNAWSNLDLRMRLLRGVVSKRRFLTTVQRRRTLREKRCQRFDRIKTFVVSSEDLFQRCAAGQSVILELAALQCTLHDGLGSFPRMSNLMAFARIAAQKIVSALQHAE